MLTRLKHAIRALFAKQYIIVTVDKEGYLSICYDCPAKLFDVAKGWALATGKRVMTDGTPVEFDSQEWHESSRAVDEANDIINGIL